MASHEGKPADAALPPPYRPPVPTRDSIALAVAQRRQELAEQTQPLIEDVLHRFTEHLVKAIISERTCAELELDIGALWVRHEIPFPFDVRLAVSIISDAFKDSDYDVAVYATGTSASPSLITLRCIIHSDC